MSRMECFYQSTNILTCTRYLVSYTRVYVSRKTFDSHSGMACSDCVVVSVPSDSVFLCLCVYGCMYKALRSAGGLRRPPRSLRKCCCCIKDKK